MQAYLDEEYAYYPQLGNAHKMVRHSVTLPEKKWKRPTHQVPFSEVAKEESTPLSSLIPSSILSPSIGIT